MRDVITTIGELVGALAVAVGVGCFDWRVGLIVGGAELVGFSYVAAGDDEPPTNPQ